MPISEERLVELTREVIYTTMEFSSAWSRGLKGKKQQAAKLRAVEALFVEVVGRKPTSEEHDKLGTATAAVY